MCTVPIAIGAAIGAATSAATGGDLKDIALSAAIGGATAHFSPGSFGIKNYAGGGGVIKIGGLLQATAVGLGAGYVQNQLLAQPELPGYTPAAQQSTFQNFNTNIATTGSGGRQAAKSLATAISRTKKRKLTQDDVGDLSLDTSSFTNTGLQLA